MTITFVRCAYRDSNKAINLQGSSRKKHYYTSTTARTQSTGSSKLSALFSLSVALSRDLELLAAMTLQHFTAFVKLLWFPGFAYDASASGCIWAVIAMKGCFGESGNSANGRLQYQIVRVANGSVCCVERTSSAHPGLILGQSQETRCPFPHPNVDE